MISCLQPIKPRKKQRFSKKDGDDTPPKRRRVTQKQKYRHQLAWMEEDNDTPEGITI